MKNKPSWKKNRQAVRSIINSQLKKFSRIKIYIVKLSYTKIKHNMKKMKKIGLVLLLLTPVSMYAQFGVKGGLNFAKVANASDINSEKKSGFHIGVLLAPPSKSIMSSRTELMFSRQGYNYKTTNTGTVDLDYIQLGQLMSIN